MLKNFIKLSISVLTLFILMNYSHAQQYWGAAYINKQTGITGAAWNWENKQSAMNEAKKHCVRKNSGKAGQCEMANAFFNGCFALYWSPITKNYGWGADAMYSRGADIRGAKACREYGGKECKKVLSFCTTRIY